MPSPSAAASDSPAGELPWTRADHAALAGAALATVVAMIQFWRKGVPGPVDFIAGIYRAFELAASIQGGLLYPRLGMGLNFTYSAPLFEFYAPLASYLTVAVHTVGLGYVEAEKVVFMACLFVGAMGAYVYARWLYSGRLPAFVACGAYVFAPYYLSNAYERGAIAESVAMAFVPWMFWSFHRLLDSGKWVWILPSAGSLALLILSHNIPALFAFALLAAYLILLALQTGTWKRLPLLAIGAALGLMFSAFYWFPALADRSYSAVDSTLLVGHMSVFGHLAPVSELLQLSPAYDYWSPLRHRLGLWQVAIGVLAILALPLQMKTARRFLVLLAGASVLMLMVQLDASRWFWDTAPLVRYIQFPWRLGGLISFAVAIMAGSLVQVRVLTERWKPWAAALILIPITLSSMWSLSPDRSDLWYMFTSPEVGTPDAYFRGGLGFPVDADFMPVWTAEESKRLALPRPAGSPTNPGLANVPSVQILEESLSRFKLLVRATEPVMLQLHKLYYPGWQATDGNEPLTVKPNGQLGLVSVDLLSGERLVTLEFGETPLRAAADVVSLLALAAGIVATAWVIGGRRALITSVGIAVLLAGASLTGAWPSEAVRHPTAFAANLQDEIHLVGFDAGSASLRPGGTLHVRFYWLVQKTPVDDYKVFIHLVRPGDPAQVAQADAQPMLGYSPTTRWEPGELVADDHELELPSDLPPGEYQLLVGMYRPSTMQNLIVRDAPQVMPGERIVLTTLRVSNE